MDKASNKLNKEELKYFKGMKKALKTSGGEMFSYPDTGITILLTPTTAYEAARPEYPLPKFYEVSFSYCNMETDKFNKKRGKYLTLSNYNFGFFVKIPSLGWKTPEYLADELNLFIAR